MLMEDDFDKFHDAQAYCSRCRIDRSVGAYAVYIVLPRHTQGLSQLSPQAEREDGAILIWKIRPADVPTAWLPLWVALGIRRLEDRKMKPPRCTPASTFVPIFDSVSSSNKVCDHLYLTTRHTKTQT